MAILLCIANKYYILFTVQFLRSSNQAACNGNVIFSNKEGLTIKSFITLFL